MKQFRKTKASICILLLILICFGTLCACQGFQTEYELDTSRFNDEVAYNSTIDLSGLTLKITLFSTEYVQVNSTMLVSCDSTDSVGDKTLIIEYEGREFTIEFTVKYQVTFVANGEIVDTQMVLSADEIQLPAQPTLANHIFQGWTPEIPATLNDNVTFEAVFIEDSLNAPQLNTLTATYGDTLATLQLPSNEVGQWTFVDDLTTPVGNAGQNTFDVVFVPFDTQFSPIESVVQVAVARKVLTFENVQTTFTYDGQVKMPTYDDFAEEVTVMYFGNSSAIDAGEYPFSFSIVDNNYTGAYTGVMTIEKAQVSVSVDDQEINYGETLPTFTYQAQGLDESLLYLSINVMNGSQLVTSGNPDAGEYVLTATTTNANVDLTVDEGQLVINKIVYSNSNPVLSDATAHLQVYGNALRDVEFAVDSNGTWSWQNGQQTIDRNEEGKFSAVAQFTPEGATATNYLPTTYTVTFDVAKRQVEIRVDVLTSVYTGEKQHVEFSVWDGEREITSDVTVSGTEIGTNAGTYPSIKLSIDNHFYTASKEISFTIEKANPTTDFSQVFDVVYGDPVSQIVLEEGYVLTTTASTFDQVGQGQKFEVRYTPVDTQNYNVIFGEITINVAKATATISNVQQLYQTIYNTEVYTIADVSASHNEAELVYTYIFNGEAVSQIKNAGEYTVTITLPETDHYLGASATTIVRIAKATISQSISAQSAFYGQTLGEFNGQLPENELGGWSWKTGTATTVGEIGRQSHVAVFTPNDTANYEIVETTVYFNVAKARVATPELAINSFVFTGNQISVEVEENLLYTIGGTINATNVGEYQVEIALNDTTHYEWTTGNTDSYAIAWSITKAQAVISNLAINGWTYGESANLPTANTNFGTIVYSYSVDGVEYTASVPTNAGAYFVKASVETTENWNGSTSEAVQFTIAKATPVTDFATVWTAYYGQRLSDITLPSGYQWKENSTLSIVDNGQTFKAVFTPEDTDNYLVVEDFFTVNVQKATATIGVQNSYSFTYNGIVHTLGGITASHNETTLVYTYVRNGEAVNEIKNAGNYMVTITLPESAHYLAQSVTTTVTVAQIQNTQTIGTLNAVYGDKLSTVALIDSAYGTWSWKDCQPTTTVGNAGTQTHVAVFTPTDTVNYASRELAVTVNVAKQTINVPSIQIGRAHV